MKVKIVTKTNTESGTKQLPSQFSEHVRPDIIKRAVLALQANKRQAYGAKPGAGMRHSAELSRRRRKYRGSYGFGISRVPRKILSRRGTRFNWEGAIMPGTKGGRRAHPPKADKKWNVKINKKENTKAIRSALAATVNKKVVAERGHKVPDNYPFIIKDIESVSKTKELEKILRKLGFGDELERTSQPRKKSGKARRRGRGKTQKPGLLIVVSKEDVPVVKAASSLPGVDAVFVKALNAELLAPGTHPGRISLFTEEAVDLIGKEKIFRVSK